MPELPEVEVIVQQLKANPFILKHRISNITILRPKQWLINSSSEVINVLKNQYITDIWRRAKYIIFEFCNTYRMVVHLRMTGKFISSASSPKIDAYTRDVFYFNNGASLQYHDVRGLGRLFLLKPGDVFSAFEKLGVEPLSSDFTVTYLEQSLAGCKLQIKDYLMNQGKIAGIGNIYASEILFRSKIHPGRSTQSMNKREVKKLYQMVRQVLQMSIEHMGTTVSDYRTAYNLEGNFQNLLQVYGKATQPCPRCGMPIRKIIQKQRSTFFCENCQQ